MFSRHSNHSNWALSLMTGPHYLGILIETHCLPWHCQTDRKGLADDHSVRDMMVYYPSHSGWCTIQISIGNLKSQVHSCYSHVTVLATKTNAGWLKITATYYFDSNLFSALKHSNGICWFAQPAWPRTPQIRIIGMCTLREINWTGIFCHSKVIFFTYHCSAIWALSIRSCTGEVWYPTYISVTHINIHGR